MSGEVTGIAAIRLDRGRCVGAGQCVLAAPEVFDQDEDGFGILRAAQVPGGTHRAVAEAELLCPVRAITTASVG